MIHSGRARRASVSVWLALVGLSLGVRLAEAQRPEPRVFRNAPAPRWVAHPTAPGEEYGWKGMLAMGLTTTPENPEPTRSDSHGWSAHSNYGLLATVLGVGPDGPGWRSVRIAPALGPLPRASGRIPHPRGEIDVTLARSGAAGLRAEVTLPPGVAGRFLWRGREVPLREGRQVLDLKRARA